MAYVLNLTAPGARSQKIQAEGGKAVKVPAGSLNGPGNRGGSNL